jgi:outer membrane protein assembly factor BamB
VRLLWAALAGSLALPGCSSDDSRKAAIFPADDAGARLNLTPALVKQVTLPDNFVLRPDEFAGVVPDPSRKLIYVGNRAGTLMALRMEDGAVEWENVFPGAISSQGVLADDDKLLLLGTDNGELVAFDLETKKPRWTYETTGTIRNEPVVHGGTVFIVNSRDQVFALDLATGAWRWQYDQPYPTEFTVHGHAGLAYHAPEQGDEAAGTLYTGFGNGKVAAIGATSGEALWVASVAPRDGGDFVDADATPLINADRGEVVVAGQNTGVYGLALTDGGERWFRPVRGAGTVVRGPRGLMVFSSGLEGVFALEHGGRVRWRQQLDPGFVSTPLVVGDIAFITHSDDGLLAYDIETSEYLGGLDNGSGISGPPIHDPVFGRFYAVSNRGLLMVFRMQEG